MLRASGDFGEHRSRTRLPVGWHVITLLAVSVGVRLLNLAAYYPRTGNDTAKYFALAQMIRTGDFSGYDGWRTPGYPLLIAAAGGSYLVIEIIQSVLGCLAGLMLYDVTVRRTGNRRVALATGLGYALSLNLLIWEITVLTEATSLFLVMLSVWLFDRTTMSGARRIAMVVLLSVSCCAAALTRPLLLTSIPVFAAFVWGLGRPGRKLQLTLAYLLPVIALIGGWCWFNMATVQSFTFTTMTGINLVQHTGKFVEYAPDEFSGIRDIYLEYRARCANDRRVIVIFRAYPEMLRETGWGPAQLSDELTRMSLVLIARHPLLYLASVARAYKRFWTVWKPGVKDEDITPRFRRLKFIQDIGWDVERRLLLVAYLLFALATLTALRGAIRPRANRVQCLEVLCIAVLLCGSVGQALANFGDAARYLVPFMPLLYFVVAMHIWRAWTRSVAKRQGRVAVVSQEDKTVA